jgi:hypothetical protein
MSFTDPLDKKRRSPPRLSWQRLRQRARFLPPHQLRIRLRFGSAAEPPGCGGISNFLLWCISPQGGSAASFLDPVHFIALPTSIRARSEIQIADIQ